MSLHPAAHYPRPGLLLSGLQLQIYYYFFQTAIYCVEKHKIMVIFISPRIYLVLWDSGHLIYPILWDSGRNTFPVLWDPGRNTFPVIWDSGRNTFPVLWDSGRNIYPVPWGYGHNIIYVSRDRQGFTLGTCRYRQVLPYFQLHLINRTCRYNG